jgi:hypothetical protein
MKVLCILSLIIELFSIVSAINWQTGNWAMSCDFKGNDLSNKLINHFILFETHNQDSKKMNFVN